MKHDDKKLKSEHSMISNMLFFLKLLFSVSPLLVIGECLWSIILDLPIKLISVLGVKYMIDIYSSGEDMNRIFVLVLVIAVVLVVSRVFSWLFREIFFNVEREKVYKGINTKFYEKAKSLDLSSYDDPHYYSDFILSIESSSDSIQNLLGLVARYVSEIVSFVTISSVLLTIDPVCLLIIIGIVLVFLPLSRKLAALQMKRRIDNTKFHRRSDYFQRIFYLQDYAKEVRMNNIRPLLLEEYNDAADKVIENQKKYQKKICSYYFIQTFGIQILGFMFILPLYLGYCVLVKQSISAGDFVATFNGAYSIAASLNMLTVWAVTMFQEQGYLIEKYRSFLGTESKIKDGGNTAEVTDPKPIEIKNLSFTYPGNTEPTLNNINMTIKPYEKIALVGFNGAGKTTLTNLLLRLYDPDSGEILIDGENINDVTIESHRNRFSAVFQDFQIFACSIGENVALDTDPDEERALDSLKHSDFNKELKNGAKTELLREFDDEGIMLSGGETQKVAIARAFYKNCPYVILDEPSANLDPIAEYNLNQAILDVARHKTVVFISHRLSTTVNADKIYVMENGKIIESGSHSELMALNKTYAKMFNMQAEKYQID